MRIGEKTLLEKLVNFLKKYKILIFSSIFLVAGGLVGYSVFSFHLEKKDAEITNQISEVLELTEKRNLKEAYEKIFLIKGKEQHAFTLDCLKYALERDLGKKKEANNTLEKIKNSILTSEPVLYENFNLIKEFMIGILTKDLYKQGFYKLAAKIQLEKNSQQNPNQILILYKALSLVKDGRKNEALIFLKQQIDLGNHTYVNMFFKILKEKI